MYRPNQANRSSRPNREVQVGPPAANRIPAPRRAAATYRAVGAIHGSRAREVHVALPGANRFHRQGGRKHVPPGGPGEPPRRDATTRSRSQSARVRPPDPQYVLG